MAETIDKVRHTTLTQEKETQGVIEKLNAENSSLKQQMENKHEALKRDNVWLVNAVQGLKDETMELQRYAALPFLILSLVSHMWLEGCLNSNKMEQCWECNFLKLSKHIKTK